MSQKFNTQKLHESTISRSKSNADDALTLDSNSHYTICLLNSKQTFTNFESFLLAHDKNLSIKIIESNEKLQQLVILKKNFNKSTDPNWKVTILSLVVNYFDSKALYRTVKIPNEILECANNMKKLEMDVIELNRSCNAIYFRIEKGLLHGYGLKKPLQKRIDSMASLFKSIFDYNVNRMNKLSSKSYGSQLEIEIEASSMLNLALTFCNSIFSDFKKNVKELNGEVTANMERVPSQFKVQCILANPDPIAWSKDIQFLVKNYENSRLKQKKISIPPNLRREKVSQSQL